MENWEGEGTYFFAGKNRHLHFDMSFEWSWNRQK